MTSTNDVDTTQYLAVLKEGMTTLYMPPAIELSLYIGSLDPYNSLTFYHLGGGVETITGFDLGAVPGASANGKQYSAQANGRFTFRFDTPVIGVDFQSSNNSFEISNIGVISVPEPEAWAMMLIGIGFIGFAKRRQSYRTANGALT